MRYVFKPRFVSVLLILIICSLLINLGVRQLNHFEKKKLQQLKHHHPLAKSIEIEQFIQQKPTADLSGYHVSGHGKFDNTHRIIIKSTDQKGYELFTPFYYFGSRRALLVDRGFYANDNELSAAMLPIFGDHILSGKLTLPSTQIHQFLNSAYYKYVLIPTQGLSLDLFRSSFNIAIELFILAGSILTICLLWSIKKS
jgi:hypothetical protein